MGNILLWMRLNKKHLFFAVIVVGLIIIGVSVRNFPENGETFSKMDSKNWKQSFWDTFSDSGRSPHDILKSVLRPERFDSELKVPKDWYKANCYGTLESIDDLGEALERWKKSQIEECKEMHTLFTDMYHISQREGHTVISGSFSEKVLGWLNNKNELLEEAKKQTIYTISNKYSQESTVCNPLRAKRPGASGGKVKEFVEKIIKETEGNCDFCTYKENTAKDIFGSVESEHAVSISNTFKIEKFHGLIIMKHHNPLEFSLKEFLDFFNVAQKWFLKAHASSRRYIYPHVYWDILPKASASQVHPHIHVCLSADGYYAKWNQLYAASLEFSQVHQNQNYFTAMTQIHHSLGLAVQFGNATAFPYLTPQGGHEVVVLSRNINKDFYMLTYFVMKALIEDANLYAISAGMVFPPLESVVSDGGEMPLMARILERGPADTQRSDISSIELFGTPNVNIDPFAVKRMIAQSINKRRHEDL